MNQASTPPTIYQRWQHFSAVSVRGFHAYANWLVAMSWKRFIVLAVLTLIGANVLEGLLPSWRITETVEPTPAPARPAKPPKPVEPPAKPVKAASPKEPIHYEVTIDERGVRIVPREKGKPAEPPAPASAAASAVAPAASVSLSGGLPSLEIRLPKSAQPEELREAIEDARAEIEAAVEQARQAQRDAEAARAEAEAAREEARGEAEAMAGKSRTKVRVIKFGDFLVDLAVLLVIASAIIKASYKGRFQAEVKAAKAAETAEAESLKRQVVEARMAAMQAQVEPHFLFNTLASIDHLIETDPPRASQMQKNLIALLRASMPTMREANANGGRDLGRELAVIKPYLEILKVRMEERLQTEIDVPEGLMSAEFPPMMIQSLVENAIKHGLEPKAEGGSLKVKAEILHGKLAVTVADTGLGFGRAATQGTGVGLANIRERLALLFGSKASVTVAENQPSGTVVTITVPYTTARKHDDDNDTQGAHA
ncbi:sensor histidine kinase [Roseateles sp.]|jgi:signal transduction histidine kinase|uniref:sensor histidine kinase n=1 Tax=Roseateles sp. TaxID=1971397 RepID=UPI0037C69994